MTGTYQSAYQLTTGTCFRCGRSEIPEDRLFLAVNLQEAGGWLTVCGGCDAGRGTLRFHGKTVVELRDMTAFGSADFTRKANRHP